MLGLSTFGRVTISREMVSRYHYTESQHYDIEQVVAKYMDVDSGLTGRYTAGNGRQIVLAETYPDELTARHAAESVLKRYQRQMVIVLITMPTVAGLFAEKVVELSGFDDAELNREYVARSVMTRLDRNGLLSQVSLESVPSN